MQIERTWSRYRGEEFKVIDGISYHKYTPDDVVRLLRNLLTTQERVKIHFDNDNGQAYERTGYVTEQRYYGSETLLKLIYNKGARRGYIINGEHIAKVTSTIKPYKVYYERPPLAIRQAQAAAADALTRIMEIAEEVEDL